MQPTTSSTGTLNVKGIDCRYVVGADLLLRRQLKYVDIFGLVPFIERLSVRRGTEEWDPPNLLFTGPKGIGKTLLAAFLAQQKAIPYLSMDCSEETRERHFKGGFVAKSGETPFIFGTAANAIQVANEHGAAMLALEELNALPNQQQKLVNSLTDFRRKLEIPELSMRMEIEPHAKLWIIATQNPTVYGGTTELNEDLRSRFVTINIPHPPAESEKLIITEMTGYADQRTLDVIVAIARETRMGATAYELSTRDLVELVELMPRVGWDDVMFLLSQKFDLEDRKVVLDRIADITSRGTWASLAERCGAK